MEDNKGKKEKRKKVCIIVAILLLCKFLMSDFAYNHILKYQIVTIIMDIATLILVAYLMKKKYNKHVNKFITIITYCAVSVFTLYYVAWGSGIYTGPILKILKELQILGTITVVTVVIYSIQCIKVNRVNKDLAE